ncbi:MAG: hypothetical protein ACPGSM_21400, partial [Thiolinea sp.]
VLSRVLLGKEHAEEAELEAAFLSANPDQLLKLKEAEYQFERDMAEIGFKDRNSARELAKTNMFPQVVLSTVYTAAFVLVFVEMLHGEVQYSIQQTTLINTLMGVLTAGQVQILNFWFGSSHGSKRKTELAKP